MVKRVSRQEAVLQTLLEQITRGELAPGARLPLRAELEQRFGVANQTMQRVMSRLIEDGFVIPRGRLGTFVCEHPPHLHRVGVVLTVNPADPVTWDSTKFETFVYREALAMRDRGEADLAIYPSIRGHPDSPDQERLITDLRTRQLAGLFAAVPHHLEEPRLAAAVRDNGLPCVGIGSAPLSLDNSTAINLGSPAILQKALAYLRQQRRRRIALLTSGFDEPLLHLFSQHVREQGMTTRPYWQQVVSPGVARAAHNCALLLMQTKDRPDALFITDDVLVEHATAGLAESGVNIPRALTVVAHCNFPYVTPSLVPARRVGFDIREVLRTALDLVARRRRHATAVQLVRLPPKFDDEVLPAPNMECGDKSRPSKTTVSART